ncbi:Rossmann-fold NAD(P)-binding domain-containing protein [Haloglomus irregulare]|uniref:hypothetical protein n=1 Tax=Haloglomus irregulare TaxID=2234134 RepID=UPI001186F7A5|nr:hypothetical protein [Haloglomus irregulare]
MHRSCAPLRVGGALDCSQEAVADMIEGDGSAVILADATTSVRGRGGTVGLWAPDFGARGLAEPIC